MAKDDAKKPTLRNHPLVDRLKPDDDAAETVSLVGYLGPSKRAGHRRLYLDAGLRTFCELPEEAIRDVREAEDEEAPSRITIDADTPVEVVRTSRQRTAAGFLAGAISGGLLGRAGGAGRAQICPTVYTARPTGCDQPCLTVVTANPTDCEVCLTVVTANPTDCSGGPGGQVCLTVVTANPTDCSCSPVRTARPTVCDGACLTVVTANPTDCGLASQGRRASHSGPVCLTVVTANPTDCGGTHCLTVVTANPTDCGPVCLTVVTANPTDCGRGGGRQRI